MTICPLYFIKSLSSFLTLKAVDKALAKPFIPPPASSKDCFTCVPHSANVRLLNPNLLLIPFKSFSYVLNIVLNYRLWIPVLKRLWISLIFKGVVT